MIFTANNFAYFTQNSCSYITDNHMLRTGGYELNIM